MAESLLLAEGASAIINVSNLLGNQRHAACRAVSCSDARNAKHHASSSRQTLIDPLEVKFRCTTTGVSPSHCQVRKGDNTVLKTNKGNYDYGFYGVYATSGGSCGCGFPVPEDFFCPPKQNFAYSNRHMVNNKDWHNDSP